LGGGAPNCDQAFSMKTVLAISLLVALSGPAFGTCVSDADSKKLAGAARTSFLGKCERDATASCDAQAAEKKLQGAAKTSFTGKCVRDTVGN
jgi:hypothetical protein